ncbi:hypothetical protein CVPH_0488 [Abyssogena phaseoliformis symbiont OG214]|uniref:hypothetical protein n=1 Tax=Abyssogena phaseoliformis symbiont TaxID=596095 RepID=UPI0019160647|nr:hypothetical protein [Abyssogena phaseoliformis symbiont]MBW5288892.1 hypothetical protein [Candidatus Ruthia sp. Apha_13_S6]BBB22562.1 hypothetical protein CVPH_0488 [Abyssogena phaseoliformis symbiont OG214]
MEKEVLVKIKQQFERDGYNLFPSKSLLFRGVMINGFNCADNIGGDEFFNIFSKFRNLENDTNNKKTTTEAFRILDNATVEQLNFIINQIYLAKGYGYKISNKFSLIRFILLVFNDKKLNIIGEQQAEP